MSAEHLLGKVGVAALGCVHVLVALWCALTFAQSFATRTRDVESVRVVETSG